MIAARLPQRLPEPPAPPSAIRFDPVEAEPYASLWDNLPPAKRVTRPEANELLFAQDHGMVAYRRKLRGGGALTIDGVRDYATVFHGGHYLDCLSRVRKAGLPPPHPIALPPGDDHAMLDILVDSCGHVGYGQAMYDRKGIVGGIRLDRRELRDWEAYSLPLDDAYLAGLKPLDGAPSRPGLFFKATLALEQPGDCYLDMSVWDKGYLWVNGQLLGRYWKIGPQQRLYCPASWLRQGDNELLVFDMHRMDAAPIGGSERLNG